MEIIEDDASSSSSSSQNETSETLAPQEINNTQQFNKKKRKAGRKKFKETRHTVYRGVRLRNGSKWVCEVREPNKKTRIWLGTYPNPEMAARAYDVAILALRGDGSPLNFPDSANLKRAKSSSAQDIREAAYEAAFSSEPKCSNDRESSSSLPFQSKHVVVEVPETNFVDEEALFNIPSFYNNMAEGLIITPPGMKSGLDWGDEFDTNIDLTLWRY